MGVALGILSMLYAIWSPGRVITDGRHDRHANGLWLQHGWLGDDLWFSQTGRDPELFRNLVRIRSLAERLEAHHIRDVYPHLAPTRANGHIAGVDEAQARQFLAETGHLQVMPWVGGIVGEHAFPESAKWRATFVASIVRLLEQYPELAGVHVNIEPMPSGDRAFLVLLQELRNALPAGKTLSVAAHAPRTWWQPLAGARWSRTYFMAVADEVDQVVVMLYDTTTRNGKLYQYLVASWTVQVLTWVPDTHVLLGLPVYEDAGVGYHDPRVENLQNGLRGIHMGLTDFEDLPANYQGIALYSEWEMDTGEWETLRRHFLASGDR